MKKTIIFITLIFATFFLGCSSESNDLNLQIDKYLNNPDSSYQVIIDKYEDLSLDEQNKIEKYFDFEIAYKSFIIETLITELANEKVSLSQTYLFKVEELKKSIDEIGDDKIANIEVYKELLLEVERLKLIEEYKLVDYTFTIKESIFVGEIVSPEITGEIDLYDQMEYISVDENIAKVTSDNQIIGVSPGKVYITSRIKGTNNERKVMIEVVESEEMIYERINEEILILLSLDISLDEDYLLKLDKVLLRIKSLDNLNTEKISKYNEFLALTQKIEQLKYQDYLNNLDFTIICNEEIIVSFSETLSLSFTSLLTNTFEILYSVSDENIIELSKTSGTNDEEIELFAISEGVCEVFVCIKGTDNIKSILIKVIKEEVLPKNIIVNIPENILVDKLYNIDITVYPLEASQEVDITISNDNVMINIIDSGYSITGLKEGKTIITVKCKESTVNKSIEINILANDVNPDIALYDDVTRDMTSPAYWINLVNNPDEVILTMDQIRAKNEANYKISGTNLVDLLSYPKSVTFGEVKQMIQKYTISSSYKINGQVMSTSYKNALINNTNLNYTTDSSSILCEYGLLNEFSAIRSFPTSDIATTTNQFDRFQETGLEVGAGVIILHTSADNLWYFVQAYDYYGWIKASSVMKVSFDDFSNYLNPDRFLLILGEEVIINNVIYRMGTKLLLESSDSNSHTALVPGTGSFNKVVFPKTSDVATEYLDYTLSNLYKTSFKMLGNNYRWGDSDITGHDCSSTMQAIYACFGMVLGRNVSNQSPMAYSYINLNGLSSEARKQKFDSILPGALAFLSGHVVMYIGSVNGNYYILHNFTSGGCCNITTMSLSRSSSQDYLEAFYGTMEMK